MATPRRWWLVSPGSPCLWVILASATQHEEIRLLKGIQKCLPSYQSAVLVVRATSRASAVRKARALDTQETSHAHRT